MNRLKATESQRWRGAWLTAMLIVLAGTAARGDGSPWTAGVFSGAKGFTTPYRLLMPPSVREGATYPLVIFLHGAGERGQDNQQQLKNGVDGLFSRDAVRERFPAFVVVPQCPQDCRWVEVDWHAASHRIPAQPSAPMANVMQLIGELRTRYPIDPDRIYVMGMSMGGFGVWDLLAREPRTFAAAVAICGGADEATAPRIAHVPVWVFHGSADPVVQPIRSIHMVDALRKAGGHPVFTLYDGLGHAAWVPALSDPGLLEWLFAQRRAAQTEP